MTDDLQAIDGVGPAREENLVEAGYETYADLAEADHEQLADVIDRMSEDTALELVVQAQNLADLKEAEVVEGVEVEEEASADDEAADTDVSVEPDEAEEEPTPVAEQVFDVEIELDGRQEYDTLYHTLLDERCTHIRTNRTNVDVYEALLDEVRNIDAGDTLRVQLTGDDLNDLHNAVLQKRLSYQGDNLIDYMNALKGIEAKVNANREEFLF